MSKKYLSFILILLCFLSYCNIFSNAFVSDDIPSILNNPQVSDFKQYIFEPASLLNSFCYLLGKNNPFIYHLVSVALHALNSVLLFLFLGLFFKKESAFWGAALFCVHPAHTEAVTWISGKPYLIMTLFTFIGYFLYHRSFSYLKPKILSYLFCLIIFSYFVIAKHALFFIFPFLIILMDVVLGRWRKNWKYWIPFFVILIAGIFWAKGAISGRIFSLAKSTGGLNQSNLIFNLAYSFFAHLKLLFWPAKLTLYHEPAIISFKMLSLELTALVILFLFFPFIFKKAKEIFFAVMFFALFLAPTYSPVMVSWLVAERYIYLPSIALSIIIAYLYERRIIQKFKSIFLVLFVIVIILCLARTFIRNMDWKTTNILWRKTVEVSPYSPRAHNNMGDVYAREGNISGALDEFRQAIKLQPGYADAYHNLANTYQSQGDLDNAVKYYKQALTFNPELFESYRNLGGIYLNKGEFFLAEKYLQDALRLRPEDLNVRGILDTLRGKRAGQD